MTTTRKYLLLITVAVVVFALLIVVNRAHVRQYGALASPGTAEVLAEPEAAA